MIRTRTRLATMVAASLLCGTRLESQPAPVPAPTAAAATPNRYVYLIRHGDYDRVDNADDRVANGLNALGRDQAELLGKRLAALPVRMNSIVSSNYTRAMDTADIVGRILSLPVQRDTLLHECTPTTTRADYMRDHSAAEIAGCDANLEAAWAKYIRPAVDTDGRDLVVCHGNVIRWFVARALGGRTDQWHLMDIGNASITVIVVRSDGSLKVASFSDVGHLPPDKQTWTGRGAGYRAPPPPKP